MVKVAQISRFWTLLDTKFIAWHDQYLKQSKYDLFEQFFASLGQKYLAFKIGILTNRAIQGSYKTAGFLLT